jgi:hypothetical protein
MVFTATVNISANQEPGTKNQEPSCPTCIVVLKQTYHPNWKATVFKKVNQDRSGELAEPTTVNGKSVEPINVFPSYVGVRLEEPGEYEVVFTYTPSKLKMFLLFTAIACTLSSLYFLYKNTKK